MTFVGLDLHQRYVTACALDAGGAVLAEAQRLPATLDALGVFLAALPGPVTVAMEATLYWAWLAERLEAGGFTVQVDHADQVKLIWQARSKTDPIDARKTRRAVADAPVAQDLGRRRGDLRSLPLALALTRSQLNFGVRRQPDCPSALRPPSPKRLRPHLRLRDDARKSRQRAQRLHERICLGDEARRVEPLRDA